MSDKGPGASLPLVRPGNPRRIRSFEDLLRPGMSVLVVNVAGQNGAWEDAAGRKGDIRTVSRLRSNIAAHARKQRQTYLMRTITQRRHELVYGSGLGP